MTERDDEQPIEEDEDENGSSTFSIRSPAQVDLHFFSSNLSQNSEETICDIYYQLGHLHGRLRILHRCSQWLWSYTR